MDLVEIRSHTEHSISSQLIKDTPKEQKLENAEQEEMKSSSPSKEEVKKCFALTVKDSYINNILTICEKVRPQTFLQSGSLVS